MKALKHNRQEGTEEEIVALPDKDFESLSEEEFAPKPEQQVSDEDFRLSTMFPMAESITDILFLHLFPWEKWSVRY